MASRFEREIAGICPHCGESFGEPFSDGPSPCARCQKDRFAHRSPSGELAQCYLCGCTPLYRQKDFDRKLGLGLVTLGVIASFWTYGLSLIAVTLVDIYLYRRVGDVAICYRCGAKFRRWEGLAEVPPFNLVLHDHYRSREES